MSQPSLSRSQTIRGFARSTAVRFGQEQRAREIVDRLREGRGLIDPRARRVMRDEHALRVVLATVLREDGNAIDIGANRGEVLAHIEAIAPGGRHIAYEPIPYLCEHLRTAFPKVDLRACALSDESGTAEFVHVIDSPALSGLQAREDLGDGARTERIPVTLKRLDDDLDASYVPALIKIDVEGAEVKAIRGALGTLERHRPVVVFEHGIGGADLYGSSSGELFDLLDGAGLRIFDLDGDGPYARARFEDQFDRPLWNWLAAPR